MNRNHIESRMCVRKDTKHLVRERLSDLLYVREIHNDRLKTLKPSR